MTTSRQELEANIDIARARYSTAAHAKAWALKEYYEALDKLSKELKEKDNAY